MNLSTSVFMLKILYLLLLWEKTWYWIVFMMHDASYANIGLSKNVRQTMI